ncbi:MOSC domain-containing protein [Leptolyngbya sp. PCC 6406]|uniref:MOSC domain-containing protein n=1 Tax=Leptolyngbya sp. PCC 6406 TaxID=1173264 RepID=UPI0002ACAA6B|nr:MOSC N-terminal beta barrel domain-containing protein [Leptolyngbya sp. PCC 6406]
MSPHLARIDLYPLKSLDGLAVPTATLLASGALEGDRAFALMDQRSQFINGKRNAQVHTLRSHFSPDLSHITLWRDGDSEKVGFDLTRDRTALEAWLGRYFQQPVTLSRNREMGFPDDTISPGPTVISTATLATVAGWFELSLEETRRRFRTNLEIDGVPAFWEDQLFSENGDPVAFSIGAVTLQGINPCQRCIVPTRDTHSGAAIKAFQSRFSQLRSQSLPAGVARSRFNHFYRLAVNTRVAATEAGKVLCLGDPCFRDDGDGF